MQHFWRRAIFLTLFSISHTQSVWCEDKTLDFERKALLKVAHSLEKSLNELRALEKAKALQSNRADMQLRQAPEGGSMGQIVTIEDWDGPLESFLKTVADKYHYQLNIIGRKPSLPILISISTQNKTLGTAIQDADLQAGSKAHVTVDHSSEPVIELRYV